MDLFSTLAEDYSVDESIEASVRNLCDFTKALDEQQLKSVVSVRKARDFDLWEKTVRQMQVFAYGKDLKDQWWSLVELIDREQKGHFSNSAWDSVYDHAMALLLAPWAGKTWSQKDYDLLTAPLTVAGFKS